MDEVPICVLLFFPSSYIPFMHNQIKIWLHIHLLLIYYEHQLLAWWTLSPTYNIGDGMIYLGLLFQTHLLRLPCSPLESTSTRLITDPASIVLLCPEPLGHHSTMTMSLVCLDNSSLSLTNEFSYYLIQEIFSDPTTTASADRTPNLCGPIELCT